MKSVYFYVHLIGQETRRSKKQKARLSTHNALDRNVMAEKFTYVKDCLLNRQNSYAKQTSQLLWLKRPKKKNVQLR